MTQAANPLRRPIAPVSFLLGMIAAIPEMLPRRLWKPTRPITKALNRAAPFRGRFYDGYDLVADFACRKIAR